MVAVRKMSNQEQSPPTGANVIDDELHENVQYLVNLRTKTYKDVDYIIYNANVELAYERTAPTAIRDMAETIVNVVTNTYNEALEKAETLAKAYSSSDFKTVLLSAIEIYADINAINNIADNLLQKYVFRYTMHGFTNELDKKLQKINDVVKYLLDNRVVYYSLAHHEYPKLLNDILHDISMFYDLHEPDSTKLDYMSSLLQTLRKQIEDNDDEDKAKYAILSDVMDLVQDSYGSAVISGRIAYNLTKDAQIGDSDICEVYDDPALFGILCDEEADNAYKADKINFTELLEQLVEAYTGFKAMKTLYSILKQYGISDEDFERETDELIEKTKDMMRTIINYYVK